MQTCHLLKPQLFSNSGEALTFYSDITSFESMWCLPGSLHIMVCSHYFNVPEVSLPPPYHYCVRITCKPDKAAA